MLSNIWLWYFLSFLTFCADAYFTPSLILFIISTVKKKNGATAGIAAKQKTLKIHLIISSVLLVLVITAIIVILAIQISQSMEITLM